MYLNQLGDVLNAGVTMREAMDELSRTAYDFRLRRMSAEMAAGAAQGLSLGAQLARYPQIVPPHVRGMLIAGERAGALPKVCWELAEELRVQQGNRWKAAIAQVWFGLIFFLALLVPGLPRMIDPDGADVGAYLSYLLNIAVPVIVGFIVLWNGAKLIGSIPALANPVQSLLYVLPGSGALIRRAATARMATALEALLRAGVELQEALALAAESSGNSVIRGQLQRASAAVRAGQPLEQALKGVRFLPPMARQSLALGERSGTYERVLGVMAQDAKEGRTRATWIVGIAGYGIMTLISAVLVTVVVYFGFKGYVEGLMKVVE